MKAFMKFHFLALAFIAAASISCSTKKNTAVAQIQSASGSTLTGEATFEETSNGVKMILKVQNATPGTHAVHLYENGDCSAPDRTSAGPPWSPRNQAHGTRAEGSGFDAAEIANREVGEQ